MILGKVCIHIPVIVTTVKHSKHFHVAPLAGCFHCRRRRRRWRRGRLCVCRVRVGMLACYSTESALSEGQGMLRAAVQQADNTAHATVMCTSGKYPTSRRTMSSVACYCTRRKNDLLMLDIRPIPSATDIGGWRWQWKLFLRNKYTVISFITIILHEEKLTGSKIPKNCLCRISSCETVKVLNKNTSHEYSQTSMLSCCKNRNDVPLHVIRLV